MSEICEHEFHDSIGICEDHGQLAHYRKCVKCGEDKTLKCTTCGEYKSECKSPPISDDEPDGSDTCG